MASDKLNEVGRYVKGSNRQAELALKRFANHIPKKERARDAVSALFPFSMTVNSDGRSDKIIMHVKFNKPPPDDCAAECIATACQNQALGPGGHLVLVNNPYVPGSIRVFSEGVTLPEAQWVEENPTAGQVYVQVQSDQEMIVICYTYIIC